MRAVVLTAVTSLTLFGCPNDDPVPDDGVPEAGLPDMVAGEMGTDMSADQGVDDDGGPPDAVAGSDVEWVELCPDGEEGCEVDAATPVALDEACGYGQVITSTTGEGVECVELVDEAGWSGGPLFQLLVNGEPVPGLLRPDDAAPRFCRYEFVGGGDPEESLDRLRAALGESLDRLEPDCHVSGGMQTFPALASELLARFARNAGAVPPAMALPQIVTADEVFPAPVRVAIIDTAADGPVWAPGQAAHSPHGRDMGRIVKALGCPDCANSGDEQLQLTSHAGLDLVRAMTGEIAPDPAGGDFGYQGTVAARIYEAVARWLSDEAPEARRPLIINLSIGWEPLYNVDEEEVQQLRADAVQRAVEFAACQGALVIAAAGNDPGGPTVVEGPTWPGALETRLDACAGGGVYAPVVHAVGGVDGLDESIDKSRPDSRPRLVGYSFFAAATNDAGQDLSGPYTGTSVATAVASAAAAIVWRYQPELTAAEVMQYVYEAAVPTALPVEHCLGPALNPPQPCAPVSHRVSVCEAARQAIDRVCLADPMAGGCPAMLDCDTPGAAMGGNPAIPAMPMWAATEVPAGEISSPPQSVAGCSAPIRTGTTVGADPCPDETQHGGGLLPWLVLPQPSNPGCHVCALGTSSGTLWYEPGDWPSALTSPKLRVGVPGGSEVSYDLSVGTATSGLSGGTLYKFTGLKLPGTIKYAVVTFSTSSKSGSKISGKDQLILY